MRQRATVQNLIFVIATVVLFASCSESGFVARSVTEGAEAQTGKPPESGSRWTEGTSKTLPDEPDEMEDDSSSTIPANESGNEGSSHEPGADAQPTTVSEVESTQKSSEGGQEIEKNVTPTVLENPAERESQRPADASTSSSQPVQPEPQQPEKPKQPKLPSPRFAEWAAVKAASQGPVEVIGGYAGGCIAGASQLTENSNNYVIMKPSRLRNHGHPALIQYLEQLARKLRDDKVPPMLVEDMSGPRGGPVLKGHASHQNGLDVDISLEFFERPLTPEERETHTSPSFVIDRKVLKAEWGKNQEQLIVRAAEPSEVSRIFVAPGIKKHFCEKYPDAPWLYKLRAWWGHDDHIHVRLNCPEGQKSCKPQPALNPKETQCGADLQRWFSKAVDRDWANIQAHWAKNIPKSFPWLPPQCEKVRIAR